MSRQVSRGSAGEYHADEPAGVARLIWRVSGRGAGRCRAAHLASIRQMSGQVSRGSAGEYQADERAASSVAASFAISSSLDGSCARTVSSSAVVVFPSRTPAFIL